MTILLALWPQLGHDQLWHLLAANRTLASPDFHGLDPYGPLYFESNPPLALWLAAISDAIAHILHLPLTLTYKTLVLLLATLSALFTGALFRHLRPTLTRTNLCLLAFAFVVLFGCVPARDFGQRDHLLALLILPYLIAAALHCIDNPAARFWCVPVTFAAALGLALKPHQALIPIAVELTVLLYRRRLRLLQPILFFTAAAASYAAIRLLAPTYLDQIVPLLRDTYWAFGSLSLLQLLKQSIELDVLAILALTFCFAKRKRCRSPLTLILLAAGAAAFAAYLLQGTGWYYQQLPAISLFGLALTIELLDLTHDNPLTTPHWLPASIAALGALSLALTWHFSDFGPQSVPDPNFYAGLAPGTIVATLTTTVDDTVPPADTYHLVLAQRYPHLWLLPALLRQPSARHPIPPARLAELTRLQQTFMVEDLERWHPQLILVNRCQDPVVHCQVLEDLHPNLLTFFLQDPRFVAIFAHYHFQSAKGPYDAYRRLD